MRYIVAWMLGVPFSVIVLWYVVGHAACGRWGRAPPNEGDGEATDTQSGRE